MNAKKSPIIDELYSEYVTLRYAGFTFEQTLEHFDYLHAITLARLKKRIREEAPALEGTYLGLVDEERWRTEAATETTQTCIIIPFAPKSTEPSIALDTQEVTPHRKSA